MIELISSIFGVIFRLIYTLLGNNYALTIVIFTILTKIMIVPLTYKQQKSMKEIEKIRPLEAQIRKKYVTDKNKQNEEITKLYAEHKINPLGGCLPLLIQMPIILGMFWIIKQPLTYIKQMPLEQIKPYAVEMYTEQLEKQGKTPEQITQMVSKIDEKQIKSLELEIANDKKLVDMNFMGVNLGLTPSKTMKEAPYLLVIPALSLLIALISNKRMLKKSNLTEEQLEQQKSMMMMTPIMSTYISFIMPAALGIYWLIGSVFGLVQQIILDEKFNPKPKNELLNSGGKK